MKLTFGDVETREGMVKDLETRNVSGLEVRAAVSTDEKPGLRGYAALFDSDSEDLGGFVERIAPGAFSKDLAAKADVRALINHDTGRVIGRTKSGTLRLSEDDRGLLMDLDLPDTQEARDLMESVNRGDVDQMSFGFRARSTTWKFRDSKDEEQVDLRILEDVELLEVSVVAFPAYPQTEVAKRSHKEFLETQKENEPSYEARLQRLALAHSTKNKLEEGEL